MNYHTVNVRWSGGEVTVGTPAASNSRHGFIEDSSLTSEAAATAYGTQWLAQHSETVDQVDATLEPGAGARPWTGVGKGDAVQMPNRAGTVETQRVMGVGFTGLRRNGVPSWSFTLGSASQNRRITSQRQLSKITEGSMRGSFGSASPRIAPSFGDLPTSALPASRIPVADTDQLIAADFAGINPDAPQDRTKPYPFDEAQSVIRVECACESLVGSADSEIDIYRVAYSSGGTVITASQIDSFTWPGTIRRFTHVTELLFLKGQGIQLRVPAGGSGAHALITIQPIASSPN